MKPYLVEPVADIAPIKIDIGFQRNRLNIHSIFTAYSIQVIRLLSLLVTY
jgi:hypothetical protein